MKGYLHCASLRKNEADNLVVSLTKTFDIASDEKKKDDTGSPAEQSEEVKGTEVESIKKIKTLPTCCTIVQTIFRKGVI